MSNFSALIWAGGRDRNLTATKKPKSWPVVAGMPIWQRQIDVVRQTEPQEILWIGPVPEGLPEDIRVVFREGHGKKPLEGLLAALKSIKADRLLVLGIELAKMTPEFLRQLAEFPEGAVPFISRRPLLYNEVFAAIYPKDACQDIEQILADEEGDFEEGGDYEDYKDDLLDYLVRSLSEMDSRAELVFIKTDEEYALFELTKVF